MTVGRVRGTKRAAALLAAVMVLPVPASAGDGIVVSGQRLVAAAVKAAGPAPAALRPDGAHRFGVASAERAEVQASGLTRSGMSRGKKLAIGLGLAVAFGAIVWAIDQGVEDNTPSSRGLR